jgi:hypothetical protein
MDGQGIVMLISFFMAIPIALVSLNWLGNILEALTGLKFFLIAQINTFFVIWGILFSMFILICILAYIVNRFISPLLSLRED